MYPIAILLSAQQLASGSHIRGDVLIDATATVGAGCIIGPNVGESRRLVFTTFITRGGEERAKASAAVTVRYL